MSERRPNPAQIRYDREELLEVLRGVSPGQYRLALDRYERQRAEGKDMPCQSVVHHGPGHQSTTYCQATGGDAGHDHIGPDGYYSPDAPAQHVADLPSGGTAEWTDERPYSDEGWA